MPRLHHRTCNLCEAVCGITVELEGTTVLAIRGDPDDPFSRGHICPKAVALADLQEDPDRLRRPLRRTASGWEEIGWDEALDEAAGRIAELQATHGPDAVALYTGNPIAHDFATALVIGRLDRALGTRNRFSSSSLDELPLSLTSWAMFGNRFLAPVPDIDRTDFLLILGANPAASNGSAMTAPGVMGRIAAIRGRGGAVVLVDPRRHETAAHVDRHVFIRPNTDAFLLLGILAVLFDEGLARPGRLAPRMDGLPALEALARRFPPERVAEATAIPAEQIRVLAREFAAAPSAVCYGRMGVSTQAFGAVCHWLMTALNAVSGNLDRVGGAMFSRPAVDLALGAARTGHRGAFGRWRSRVRGLPEFDGELPAAALAEEIETPGANGGIAGKRSALFASRGFAGQRSALFASRGFAGQRSALFAGPIRGLVTVAGNPVLSAPGGARLERALPGLAYAVAIDMYLNETTRHAHLILPPSGPLEREHFDLVYYVYAVHNAAKFAPAAFPRAADARHDWEILAELALRVRRAKRARKLGRVLAAIESGIRRWIEGRLTPQRLLNVLIRSGPHGDRWNPLSKGLSLAKLKQHMHGVDLGPHVPCLPERLFTRRKRIALAPSLFMEDVARLEADLARRLGSDSTGPDAADELELVGRRQLRSNNSWLHNSPRLVKGKERCTLLMHPSDAAARRLETGVRVEVRSAVGAIHVPLEVSDAMMPGVVSLPHGWGHDRPGTRLAVATAHAGASLNDLTNDAELDALSGAAGFSRARVRVSKAGAAPRG